MAFSVRLYKNFSKRIDSTLQPGSSVSYDDYYCTLKEGTIVTAPEVELCMTSGDPLSKGYNYAYIPTFDHYYVINNWENEYNNIWIAVLSEDILATFKTEIGALNKYVTRSASAYDGSIPDMMATKLPTKTKIIPVDSPFVNTISSNDGLYIVGIQGESPSSTVPNIGGVCYYPLNATQMRLLSDYLQSGSFADLMKDDAAGLTTQVIKAMQDPAQYITSFMWFPLKNFPTTLGRIQPKIGWWNTAPLGTYPTIGMGSNGFQSLTITRNMSISIPDHPQMASNKYGKYLKASPYSLYSLMLEPWGEIVLDGSQLVDSDSIRVEIVIDLMTGAGSLTVVDTGTNSPNKGNILDRKFAQVGVSLSIAQMIYDIANIPSATTVTVATTVQQVADKVTDNWSVYKRMMSDSSKSLFARLTGTAERHQFMKSLKGTVTEAKEIAPSVVQNAASSALAYIATPEMKGVSGDILNYYSLGGTTSDNVPYHPQGLYLKITYFEVVEPDNAENGRPLMQFRTINTLTGYVECANGDHNIAALSVEKDAISSYLTGGFFYE